VKFRLQLCYIATITIFDARFDVLYHIATVSYRAWFFLLYDITSAQEMPFAMPLYIRCILHGLTRALLCVPFIFTHTKSVDFVAVTWWLQFLMEIIRNSHSCYFDCRSCWFVLLVVCMDLPVIIRLCHCITGANPGFWKGEFHSGACNHIAT